jgi:hypothetical protein
MKRQLAPANSPIQTRVFALSSAAQAILEQVRVDQNHERLDQQRQSRHDYSAFKILMIREAGLRMKFPQETP